ncbi:hypothetical protein Bca101_049285 [Brassica carinata]
MIVAFTPVVHFVFVSGMTTLSTKVCVGGDEKEKEATLKKIHLVSRPKTLREHYFPSSPIRHPSHRLRG